jgi:branched-chain amino acid transport system permease protein
MTRWLQHPPPRGVLLAFLAAGLAACFAIEQFGLVDDYVRFVLITLGINIILCVSLNLVNGWMGEFSVGHAGFMALGAYLSACVSVKWLSWGDPLWMFPLAVVGGGLLAGAVGFLLGLLSFKTRGDYLAIITLAFLMIVKSGIENIPYVGGPRGFLGIGNHTTLLWTAIWTVLTLWTIRNLVYSRRSSSWSTSAASVRSPARFSGPPPSPFSPKFSNLSALGGWSFCR